MLSEKYMSPILLKRHWEEMAKKMWQQCLAQGGEYWVLFIYFEYTLMYSKKFSKIIKSFNYELKICLIENEKYRQAKG